MEAQPTGALSEALGAFLRLTQWLPASASLLGSATPLYESSVGNLLLSLWKLPLTFLSPGHNLPVVKACQIGEARIWLLLRI